MLDSNPQRHSRGKAAILLMLGLWFILNSHQIALAEKADRDREEKLRLHLVSDKAVGFTPVHVVLTGSLSGADSEDPNFCHAAVIWIWIPPGHTEEEGSTLRQDPVCLHPEEESRVTMTYTKSFVLRRVGPHMFRLKIEGKDGTAVQSGLTKVRVLRVQ
jgi:hypothetical protein